MKPYIGSTGSVSSRPVNDLWELGLFRVWLEVDEEGEKREERKRKGKGTSLDLELAPSPE